MVRQADLERNDPVRVLTVIPTYNEHESLPTVMDRLRQSVPDGHVLVVDDNSPDGTGRLADEMAAADGNIHVLHRTSKEGLGAAYIAGFRWGLARDYDVLVEMDADCSHQPEQLPLLLDAVERGADLAIGSRYVPGGRTVNWPLQRQLLSRGGNLYARTLLGSRIHDITAGYRAFRRETLERIGLETVDSKGYCFQIDLGWRTERAGLSVVEVPITFVERAEGESKMSPDVTREAVVRVAQWGLTARACRGAGSDRVLLPVELDALGEDLLQLVRAAPLQEHVPVRALVLLVGVHRLLAVDDDRFLAGLRHPHRRDLRLRREGHRDLLAVRGAVLDALARGRLDTGLRLHGLGAQTHSPEAAVAHCGGSSITDGGHGSGARSG